MVPCHFAEIKRLKGKHFCPKTGAAHTLYSAVVLYDKEVTIQRAGCLVTNWSVRFKYV